MSFPVTCPECDSTYTVPDTVVGKKIRCKSCQAVFRAADLDLEEESPPARVRDEDDDPRPSRSRRRSDDDEEVRPRRKAGKKKPKSPLPYILGLIAALVLAVGAILFVAWTRGAFDDPPVENNAR